MPVFDAALAEALLWLGVWLLILWQVPNTQQIMGLHEPAHELTQAKIERDPLPWVMRGPRALYWRPNRWWGLLIGLLFAISVLNLNRVSEFLYYQF